MAQAMTRLTVANRLCRSGRRTNGNATSWNITQVGAFRRARVGYPGGEWEVHRLQSERMGDILDQDSVRSIAGQLSVEPAETTETEPVRQPKDPDPGKGQVRADTLRRCVHYHLVSQCG